MLIFAHCTADLGGGQQSLALASIQTVAQPEDLVLSGLEGQARSSAFNVFIQKASTTPGCEGLVLIDEDAEIVDLRCRAKLLAALAAEGVGVVGVIGASGLRGSDWQSSRSHTGCIFTTRGYVGSSQARGEVDAVSEHLMAISPRAFSRLRFDESFSSSPGAEIDFCLQAVKQGLRVYVESIDVIDRASSLPAENRDLETASLALRKKWPEAVRGESSLSLAAGQLRLAPTKAKQVLRSLKKRLRAERPLLAQQTTKRTSLAAVVTSAGTPEPSPPTSDSIPSPEPSACTAPQCPICHALLEVSESDTPMIIECSNCDLGITWPPPSRRVEGDGLWLERYGNQRLDNRAQWHREAQRRIEWVQILQPEGCLLEIGAATGEFVQAAVEAGYDALGCEVSEWAATQAQNLGINVITGYLSDWMLRYPGLRPDIIAMWHVLEHVADPVQLLRDIAALLNPGGLLVLEVPNYGSTEARRLGIQWESAQPSDHYVQFRGASLARALDLAGFRFKQILPMSHRIYANTDRWRQEKNQALLDRRPWPSLDLLRGVAYSPTPPKKNGGHGSADMERGLPT